jgi:hypothetical protein
MIVTTNWLYENNLSPAKYTCMQASKYKILIDPSYLYSSCRIQSLKILLQKQEVIFNQYTKTYLKQV